MIELVGIYKLVGCYLQTFTNVSENDYSQSESDHSCLETDCLPQGNLCNHLVIERGYPEVEGVAQPLDDQLVTASARNQSLNAKTEQNMEFNH